MPRCWTAGSISVAFEIPSPAATETRSVPSIGILGSQVHMVEIPETVAMMDRWVAEEGDRFHYVVNTGMHGLIQAHRDPEYKQILNEADLFAPDGILVVLIARLRGFPLRKEMTGPELMWEFSRVANERGYRYFLYGDTQDTLDRLTQKLNESFPKVQIAGSYSPPFRPLTPEEDDQVVADINQAKPDVIWVGLEDTKVPTVFR